ncbi:chaperone NapD [Cytobacillus sp. IB215665]|uniref:chaperone NapD n=1 Tax=Cytobacillus sp. IB215665 TaxID=3097357 RepID=UPI002A15BEFD|nr:chaperone NapD [Cytobacillus sp. IB215665]MDX8366849.1 chaperone NapD [Cytobacillus sp. IB215665]
MVISGILIETIIGKATATATELEKITGVEVHHIEAESKVIITLEANTINDSYETSKLFQGIEGVLTVCLVYTNFEEQQNSEADVIQ